MSAVERLVDSLLEAPVAPSFTRLGYDVRSRLGHWADDAPADLTGRTVVLTGATSGLGASAATAFARLGATLVVVGRDESRTAAACADLRDRTGSSTVTHVVADMGDLVAVRAAAAAIAGQHERVDVLVHNAGALTADRRLAPDGTEATVAAQVLGPFLLTALLLPQLRAATPGRVLTMSSGGMYAARLTVGDLEMGEADYQGTEQYARAKRAQVTLNEMWAEREPSTGVVFHAVHPGWADTPGVRESLPTFRRVVGPLLRTPEQGADTLVWLATADEPLRSSGRFWHDRRPRPVHRLARTRRSDTPERRQRLWDLCVDRTSTA